MAHDLSHILSNMVIYSSYLYHFHIEHFKNNILLNWGRWLSPLVRSS